MYKYSAEGMHMSCFRKVKFKNYQKAEETAKKWGQRVYFCPICGFYHCTKKDVKSEE